MENNHDNNQVSKIYMTIDHLKDGLYQLKILKEPL